MFLVKFGDDIDGVSYKQEWVDPMKYSPETHKNYLQYRFEYTEQGPTGEFEKLPDNID